MSTDDRDALTDVQDDRWEWIDVRTFDGRVVRHIRGRCLHRDLAPVESIVTGEVVARLCLTCDAQLPGE